jgi:hypothetical protein
MMPMSSRVELTRLAVSSIEGRLLPIHCATLNRVPTELSRLIRKVIEPFTPERLVSKLIDVDLSKEFTTWRNSLDSFDSSR